MQFISHHFLVVETRMTEEQWPQKLERSDHLVGSYCKVRASSLCLLRREC